MKKLEVKKSRRTVPLSQRVTGSFRPEASLAVQYFPIFMYGSSCNYLCFCLLAGHPLHPQGMQVEMPINRYGKRTETKKTKKVRLT